MADPVLMKAIKQGEKDIENGKMYDWEDIKKEFNLNVRNKIHRSSQKGV